jgi:methyltransferase-like protein
VVSVSERPIASPLSRYQLSAGAPIPNLRHCVVELGDLEKLLLQALDGRRGRAELLDHLAQQVADGVLTIHEADQPLRNPDRVRALLKEVLEPCLERLAKSSLLVG